ncbi:MAG: LysE family translocator [Candidatus Cryptobacteroides sp.]
MPLNLLPSLLIQLFAVGYTPGPANLYALSCSMNHGRKAALRMWWGLVCGFLTAALIVAVIIHFLGEAMGEYVIWLKYIGAAYIIYLAIRMMRNPGMGSDKTKPCSFLNGFVVQLTNAKMILFDISVYSTFVLPYSERFTDLLPVCLLLMIAGPGANLVWLLAGTALHHFLRRHTKTVNIVLGLALVACALLIVLN